jgi:hypothetical protein
MNEDEPIPRFWFGIGIALWLVVLGFLASLL